MNTYILCSNTEDLPTLIIAPLDMDTNLLDSIDNLINGVDDLNEGQKNLFDEIYSLACVDEQIVDMSEIVNGRIINIGWVL